MKRAAGSDRLVVTLENHTVVGGSYEAAASCLAFGGTPRTVRPIALPDEFLDAGALHDKYGLATDGIVERVEGWL